MLSFRTIDTVSTTVRELKSRESNCCWNAEDQRNSNGDDQTVLFDIPSFLDLSGPAVEACTSRLVMDKRFQEVGGQIFIFEEQEQRIIAEHGDRDHHLRKGNHECKNDPGTPSNDIIDKEHEVSAKEDACQQRQDHQIR